MRYILRQCAFCAMALFSAFQLTGCTTATIAMQGDGENDPRVVFEEQNFTTKLQVLDIKSRRLGDLLQVSATLRNRWDMKMSFAYQFRFYDADGFPVGLESRPWIPLYMVGDDVIDVTALAPNPSVTDFKLVISAKAKFIPN